MLKPPQPPVEIEHELGDAPAGGTVRLLASMELKQQDGRLAELDFQLADFGGLASDLGAVADRAGPGFLDAGLEPADLHRKFGAQQIARYDPVVVFSGSRQMSNTLNFTYANSTVYPAGTYRGNVRFTATML